MWRRASRHAGSGGTRALPVAERRIVSMLFADLVGFTAASESRDAEDTRELLTRYFDLARTLVNPLSTRRPASRRPRSRA
jgi:class 3 adenylate cyclase